MELHDLYDAQKQMLPEKHERGTKMAPGTYRFVVMVCIFNAQGQVLIQQRRADKIGWPSYWDLTASGSVISGETVAAGASRELREETGIQIDFDNTPSRMTVAFSEGWDEIYFVDLDVAVTDLQLQASEVADVQWVDEQELKALLAQGQFIPYLFAKDIFSWHCSSGETLTE
ncbi:NUDIX domain-containing protein [Lapidilactobacillus mulanensis]|uniref:NUDIX domain-containing protein n=1 Tax=Lapidilactobacillus mulanensis TaxID=2485999 RepID=A0ABW4DNG9_9LACO|nr:NUDIX domain-containing protein [Lapidilactobacillus mulanensis]